METTLKMKITLKKDDLKNEDYIQNENENEKWTKLKNWHKRSALQSVGVCAVSAVNWQQRKIHYFFICLSVIYFLHRRSAQIKKLISKSWRERPKI